MLLRQLFSLGLLCCLSLSAHADQNDPRLEGLFKQLKSAPDAVTAAPLEESIWQIWLENSNTEAMNLMNTGVAQMNAGDLQAALATFSELIELTPDFAEAWNKRATLYYILRDYAKSDFDISKTLALEPFHFGALSGRGLVYAAQRKFEQARSAMHAALEVNPNMMGVKENLAQLDEFLLKKSI